jgi:hypothetical protein
MRAFAIVPCFCIVTAGTAHAEETHWYAPDGDREDPRATCFVCWLHLRFAKHEMTQVNYGVRRQFMVVWNRVLMAKPPH